tara:strand:- start:380 stop:649 length:270 start_codon:yes stop_codon:yes gene_type:complete
LIEVIISEIRAITDGPSNRGPSGLTKDTTLIGENSPLDSMGLVSLCIRLEEIAEEGGFEFDWTGETLSKNKSIFLSIGTLAREFERQQK